MAFERQLDLGFDVRCLNPGLNTDVVRYTADAGKFADVILSRLLLVIPIGVTAQRNPAVLNEHVDSIGNANIPLQDIHRAFCDLVIGRLGLERVADLDILRDRVHTFDAPGGCNGCDLLGIAGDVAGQADDIVIDGDANMLAVKRRIKFEFVDDVLPKLRVRSWLFSVGITKANSLAYLRVWHIDQNQNGRMTPSSDSTSAA